MGSRYPGLSEKATMGADIEFGANQHGSRQTPSEREWSGEADWSSTVYWLGKRLWTNLWFIIRFTVPMTFLAGM